MAATAATIVAISPPCASGALFLAFSGTQASPGEAVIVQTGGTGALRSISASEPVRVFLAPAEEATTITSADDSRLVLLGRLRIDGEGNGFLRFVVPDIAAGEYTTVTHCAACAASSAGRQLLPTGPFPGAFVVLEQPDDASVLPLALAAAGAAAALLVAAGWMRRRRRRAVSIR